MGLEREIEQLFQRVVELDLDKIGKRAQPAYHSYSTAPPAHSFPVGTPGSPKLKFEDLLYQVDRIELKALLESALKKIVEDREKRGLGPSKHADTEKIDDKVKARDFHGAAEHYIDSTGGGVERITVEQIHVDASDPANPKIGMYDVIKFLGVPYVHDTVSYADIKVKYPTDSTLLDRWPRYIVLVDDTGGKQEYTRYDLKPPP